MLSTLPLPLLSAITVLSNSRKGPIWSGVSPYGIVIYVLDYYSSSERMALALYNPQSLTCQ